MGRKYRIVTVGLLLVAAMSGCAHRSAKPDAASSQNAAAKPPAADSSSDDQHFRQMMDLIHKLDASPSKRPQAAAATSAAAAGTAAKAAAPSAEPPATPPSAAKESAMAADTAKQPGPTTTTVPPPGAAGIAAATVAPAAVLSAAPEAVAAAASPGRGDQVGKPKDSKPGREAGLTPSPESGAAVSAADVVRLIKMMIEHPRASYHSATGKYSYYAGGLIYAEYDAGEKWLILRNDGPSPAVGVQCRYSADGHLLDPGKMGLSGSAAACSTLVKTLFKALVSE